MVYSEKAERNWKAYEKVRRSGEFNMITEAAKASHKAGLDWQEYRFIIGNYAGIQNQIVEKYGTVEAFLKNE